MDYILPLQKLIEQFGRLNGVGYKTAVRYALSVLDMSEADVEEFARCLISAKHDIHNCEICGNLLGSETPQIRYLRCRGCQNRHGYREGQGI